METKQLIVGFDDEMKNKTEFRVRSTTTIYQIMYAYLAHIGKLKYIDYVKLFYKGKECDNEKTVEQCDIENNARLILRIC